MTIAIIFALVCAVLAIVYGVWQIQWILACPTATRACARSPPPSARARSAYLWRQYKTIAIVGVILFVVIGVVPALGLADRVGLLHRRGALRRLRVTSA